MKAREFYYSIRVNGTEELFRYNTWREAKDVINERAKTGQYKATDVVEILNICTSESSTEIEIKDGTATIKKTW